MVNQLLTISACFAISISLWSSCEDTFAQADRLPNRSSLVEVVLLDNGQVLLGIIHRSAQSIEVTTKQGSRIVLPAIRVDAIFDSLEEVYKYRASKLQEDDTQGHLSLLHWCLQHRLAPQTEEQFKLLMETDIDSKQLKYLDKKITKTFASKHLPGSVESELEAAPKNHFLDVVQTFTPLPTLHQTPKKSPTEIILDHQVALASHAESVAGVQSQSNTNKRDNKPHQITVQHALESISDRLSRDDFHQYQRRIQPLLLKGCLAAKCHNSSASIMPLFHRGRGQLVPKRFSQCNLQSILSMVDPKNLNHSPLLKMATSAHGNLDQPSIEAGSAEYILIARWIKSVADSSPELLDQLTAEAQRVSMTYPAHTDEPTYSTNLKPIEAPESTIGDPFDPSLFNRMK